MGLDCGAMCSAQDGFYMIILDPLARVRVYNLARSVTTTNYPQERKRA
jgi:hypothetical protein